MVTFKLKHGSIFRKILILITQGTSIILEFHRFSFRNLFLNKRGNFVNSASNILVLSAVSVLFIPHREVTILNIVYIYIYI
jgi:hypothetical protein